MTPYTVTMILDAQAKLENMIADVDPASQTISIDAAVIKRTDAERAIVLYRKNAEIYLIEKTLDCNNDNTSAETASTAIIGQI